MANVARLLKFTHLVPKPKPAKMLRPRPKTAWYLPFGRHPTAEEINHAATELGRLIEQLKTVRPLQIFQLLQWASLFVGGSSEPPAV